MEVTRRRGRRCKKLLDDLKDRRGYSHLNEEALDRTMWRNCFVGGFGPVIRQNTEWWWWWHIQSFDNSVQNAIIHVTEHSDKNIDSYSINRICAKHPTEKKWIIIHSMNTFGKYHTDQGILPDNLAISITKPVFKYTDNSSSVSYRAASVVPKLLVGGRVILNTAGHPFRRSNLLGNLKNGYHNTT